MKEYADVFKSERNIAKDICCNDELVEELVDFLKLHVDQTQQGGTQFWIDQRTGQVTASNFYRICHLKDTTDKTNTIKLLMNYCPMENVPEPLEWGHGRRFLLQNYISENLITSTVI